MDVRLDRARRHAQDLRDLVVVETLDVAQNDRLAVAGGQPKDRRPEMVEVLRSEPVGVWLCDRIERDGLAQPAPRAVAEHVQRDSVKPGRDLELAHPVRVVSSQGSVSPDEGILGDLLGVRRLRPGIMDVEVDPVEWQS